MAAAVSLRHAEQPARWPYRSLVPFLHSCQLVDPLLDTLPVGEDGLALCWAGFGT